ncbi:MAG: hypothetical protein ACI8Y7_000648 [Candidatus Woesearchaeota archaeon]|jgi:hypothetical protein
MGENIKLRAFPLRYRGLIDFETIYHRIFSWMNLQLMHTYENLHKDKAAGGGLREIEMSLTGLVKLDEFVMWQIMIHIKIWDAKDVEVMVDGKPKKMIQGRIQILMENTFITDHGDFYASKSPFIKKLSQLLSRTRRRDEKLFPEQPVYDKVIALQNEFKKILDIPTIAQ